MEKNICTNYVGRFGFIRSSKDFEEMVLGEDAFYDEKNDLWYEHAMCELKGDEGEETQWSVNGILLGDFIDGKPTQNCRETHYYFAYGEGFNGFKGGCIEFNEHNGLTTVQSWRNIDEITQENVDEYLNAIMRWHITGKFG